MSVFFHGIIIAGLPYTFAGQERLDEITGCPPYGASTIAGNDWKRGPVKTSWREPGSRAGMSPGSQQNLHGKSLRPHKRPPMRVHNIIFIPGPEV